MATFKGARLNPETSLNRGDYLESPNGRYRLVLQEDDGNLVLYRNGSNTPLWATMKQDEENTFSADKRIENARMQQDGNFTVNSNKGCEWDTMHRDGVVSHGGSYLQLHNNGVLALHHPATNQTLWQTETHLNEDWMGRLPDDRKLTALSIPGTHDSGTYKLSGAYTKCQSLSIEEQLWNGVRFLDIRCRYMPNEEVLTIHHGASYCELTFHDVIDQVRGFLEQNPTETVLLMVKQEESGGRDQAFAQLVEAYLRDYAGGRVYTKPTDSNQRLALTLGEVRGRIVLLKRYGEGSYGYDVKMSGGSDTQYTTTVCYQDVYGAGSYVSTKQEPMQKMFEDAREHPADGRLYLNYASMSGIMDGPESLATILNPFALECIGTSRPQRLGIVPMDFPSKHLIHTIISTN